MSHQLFSWIIFITVAFLSRTGETFFLPDQTFRVPNKYNPPRYESSTLHRLSMIPSISEVFDVVNANIMNRELISKEVSIPLIGNIKLVDFAKVAVPFTTYCCYVLATRVPDRLIDQEFLNIIIKGTYLERNIDKMKCVYKATKDGWSALNFHEKVDGKGSGIVVARSLTGNIFGGYNANGWRSTDDYYSSTASFLWYKKSNRPIKLSILPGGDAALFDYATSGPCFGASDLLIGPPRAAVMGGFAGPDSEDLSNSAGSLRRCRSSVGSTYKADYGWPARGTFPLFEVEVYCIDQ